MAAERGLSVGRFSAEAEADPSIDVDLDSRLAARAEEGDVVLESRLAGWIATNGRLAAVRVWISCDPDERARRVAQREDIDLDAASVANQRRESSEQSRYLAYYDVDITDLSPYDLVLDSTATGPEELVETIVAAARAAA